MDNSFAESDMSLSPSQILERLQVLRQLQLLQRSKLHKQQLQYEDFQEESSSVTEIVSHFTNSTSYNTFRSLLNESDSNSNEIQQQMNLSKKINEQDLIEGISILHLSQESEFIVTSPGSSNSHSTTSSGIHLQKSVKNVQHSNTKQQIALDEMPILSPKKDFEVLVMEKIQAEKRNKLISQTNSENTKMNKDNQKKPFLKRGACMARFGLKKNDLVIQNTKSLPWVKKSVSKKTKSQNINTQNKNKEQKRVEKHSKSGTEQHHNKFNDISEKVSDKVSCSKEFIEKPEFKGDFQTNPTNELSPKETIQPVQSCILINKNNTNSVGVVSEKRYGLKSAGKTWAAILTKEQDDFLRELKQSEYYKNFESPAKSVLSDFSCDENYSEIRQERESAEQKLFNLLESKACEQSFDINSSFIDKFLRRSKLENSGNSTPLVMQRCLKEHPELFHIDPMPAANMPEINQSKSMVEDVCNSEYTDCDETSTCCSCNTVEEQQQCNHEEITTGSTESDKSGHGGNKKKNKGDRSQNITNEDNIKSNMEDMNAKLIATSELLKERLKELEDEIETFRKDNAKLAQMREEIDLERKKFYEEKAVLEQKLNEDKILSEYYLAEEKEKLSKQKQTYERYVREMRGRLNKKEKLEVVSLKNEISDLKEEIRLKDAKSSSSIARLRNQIKILEKEKKELEEECEKLKKENKRILHSNEVTRRLSNLKYLEEINRKLTNMTQSQSDINIDKDVRYKAFEIEQQNRLKNKEATAKKNVRKRAKSVPNLNVTSCYAKYFSQRDVVSQSHRNNTMHVEPLETYSRTSDNEPLDFDIDDCDDMSQSINIIDNKKMTNLCDINMDNNLERIYMERFQSASPTTSASTKFNAGDASSRITVFENTNNFFLQKSSKITADGGKSISPLNRNIQNSPTACTSNKSRSVSPKLILSNRSPTIEEEPDVNDSQRSPEVTNRKSVNKTNLNPVESEKHDGTRELRFPNGNVKLISADGTYSKFIYYNGDIKETFYNEGRIKYFYSDTKTYHTTHADGLEVLEFSDGQVEKRYKDGSTEIHLPNGSIRYTDPKNEYVREEWRFPDGTILTVASNGEQRVRFSNGQVEVHTKDHKRREFPDGTVKLVYNDGTSETRYSSGRIRVKDRHGNLIMDSATR